MNTYSLSRNNIRPRGSVHRNPHIDWLAKRSLERNEVRQTKSGALLVYTGKYTGRSPKDKFIVDTPDIHDKINWNTTNVAMSQEQFEKLYAKVSRHLSSLDDLYIFDGFVGADKTYKMHVRVVSEYAYQTLFSTHLLRRPTAEELQQHTPQITVLSAPNCYADPKTDGTNSETFIVLNIQKRIVLIGGTKYSGEIKKSIFSIMNILLPDEKVLPMHCSANIGNDGKAALFFGLSGTGKTTLSADPNRQLIGDDEHGWSENGIFNFEGGCYAKCINLKKESEPQIWGAIRTHALLENVAVNETGELDFTDARHTENTRVVYPIEFIENAVLSGVGGHPSHVIFLTADAFGVLPPVARLSVEGAMYHFMSGYTSKLAGTERGITEPRMTFSPFFGGPFMARKPLVYANLLRDYLKKYKTKIYLVNTGWSGGAYGVGKRISIQATRAIITAILNGHLDKSKYRRDTLFNLDVPTHIPGVLTDLLDPRGLWKKKEEYDVAAQKLVAAFRENFTKFVDIPESIINAGPHL